MAVHGMTSGWFGNDSGPDVPWGNRVADIPFGKLDQIFTGSEDDVAASAWAPGAGLPKPQYATWVKTNYSQGDAAIFNAEHRDW